MSPPGRVIYAVFNSAAAGWAGYLLRHNPWAWVAGALALNLLVALWERITASDLDWPN